MLLEEGALINTAVLRPKPLQTHVRRGFRIIQGGRCVSNDDRIKARIKGIMREAKEDDADTTAGVILAIVKQTQRSQWVLPLVLSIVAAIATASVMWLLR